MTHTHRASLSGRQELEADKRFERIIAWKGLLTLLVVASLVIARQWWWV